MNVIIDFDKIRYTDADLLSTLKLLNIRTSDRDAKSVRREVLYKMMQMINEGRYDAIHRRLIECLHKLIERLDKELSVTGNWNIQFEDIFGYEEYEESDDLEHFLGDFCIKGVAPVG